MVDLSIGRIIVIFLNFFYVLVIALIFFFLIKLMKIKFKEKMEKIGLKNLFIGLAFLFLYSVSWAYIGVMGLVYAQYETVVLANFFLFLGGILIYKKSKKLLHCCLGEINGS